MADWAVFDSPLSDCDFRESRLAITVHAAQSLGW